MTGWPLGGSNAAEYNVGEVNFTGLQEGIILTQTFTASAGLLNLSFDYAALGNPTFGNLEGGVFSLQLDGVSLVTADVGLINPSQLINGNLSVSTITSAGVHTFGIEITRPFITLDGVTHGSSLPIRPPTREPLRRNQPACCCWARAWSVPT